jgi:hypothetical protein
LDCKLLLFNSESKRKKEETSGGGSVTEWTEFQVVLTHLGQICALKGLFRGWSW